jgi:hypothetical protein
VDVLEPKRKTQETFATTKYEIVDNWMDMYFEKVVEQMPDKNSIHLPTWMTQVWLHEDFLKNKNSGQDVRFHELQLPTIGVCDLSFFIYALFQIFFLISNY